MLGRVDAIAADIAAVEQRIATAEIGPFDAAVQRLIAIPGMGVATATAIIAKIGMDMTRFPTAGHLASWAKFSPTTKESAGKAKGSAGTGHGNAYLARALGEVAVMAGRSKTFLGARYARIARRSGKPRAILAVGRSILVIIWHLLADHTEQFHDLGPGYCDAHVNYRRRARSHIRALQALGYNVTLEPDA